MSVSAPYTLTVDEATKEKILEASGVTSELMRRDVNILKEWIKQQAHFPKNQDEMFLEICLLRCRFQVEMVKEKLERYYRVKKLFVDMFRNVEIPLPSQTTELIVPLPELTDNFERIVIVKITSKSDISDDDVMRFFKHIFCTTELGLRCAHDKGHRIIQDFQGLTFNHFKKYAMKFSIFSSAYQEAFLARVAGLEYLNLPSYVEILMQASKKFLTPAMYKKITVHSSLESLHGNVDKKFLPKEYGGDLKSLGEYLVEWDKYFEGNLPIFDNILFSEVSNEDLRVGQLKFNETFGVDGTFKTLNLD